MATGTTQRYDTVRDRGFAYRRGKVGVLCLEAENPDHGTRIVTTIATATETAKTRAARAVEAATKMHFDFVRRVAPTLRLPAR